MIVSGTYSVDTMGEGWDHLLEPETLRQLGREIIVRDAGNPQAIRLGESWSFKCDKSQPSGGGVKGSQGFIWDSDGTHFWIYYGGDMGSPSYRLKYPLQDLILTGQRVRENPTGRVIGFAKIPQAGATKTGGRSDG